MLELNPSLDVVCSHTIGGVGLLERENATILNASILAVAKRTIRGFRRAMHALLLSCSLYLTQNDGTLTSADDAAKLPIKTFASGPTNSMTGAAFLSGLDKPNITENATSRQVLVVDIGGTTTDICALLPSGFPRQAPNFVEVGGVRTAFSMPDVLSVGLGGGSIIRVEENEKVKVGPGSVGHYLTSRALCFGGSTMTSTDIVVADGKGDVGDVHKVSSITKATIEGAKREMKRILQRAIDDMKVSSAAVTILLVGGGSIVYMDGLEGVTECIIPLHHDSANAVGAAIAKVSGEVDIIEILAGRDERDIVEAASAQAIAAAVAKGADKEDVRIVEIEKLPLQYVSNKATRIRVKAIGKLRTPELDTHQPIPESVYLPEDDLVEDEGEKSTSLDNHKTLTKPSLYIDIASYRPDVKHGVWYLSEVDLEFVACGTGVLGTGGGGPSYLAYLVALEALRNGGRGKMRVISPEHLKDEDLVCFGSWYGAPSVSGEKITAGTEIPAAIDALNRILGVTDFQAVLADEIGGGNGLATFPTSVQYDRPTVDGDLMGRAYPTMEHGTPYVYGHPITPCALADGKGNISVVMSAESNNRVERMLRTTCIEMGLNAAVVARPLSGAIIKQYVIPNTISQAWYLGRAIHLARSSKSSFVEAIFDVMPGRVLYTGKVVDVQRDINPAGYTVGRCLLSPMIEEEPGSDSGHFVIPFQNEFLYAAYTNARDIIETEIACTVPDLISVLGEDGEAIGSQELRYGLKVIVIAMPAHPLWTGDARGLKVGGPEYFGLQMEWKSIGKYSRPKSVIEEFK